MSTEFQKKFPSVPVTYFNTLVQSGKLSSPKVIKNLNLNSAEAALVFLYTKARRYVKIFDDYNVGAVPSRKLKEEWQRLVMDENISLEVITHNPTSNSCSLDFLKSHLHDRFNNRIYALNWEKYEELLSTVDSHKDFRFTTVDGIAYRYEYDTTGRKAFMNFNDRETSSKLERYFGIIRGEKFTL